MSEGERLRSLEALWLVVGSRARRWEYNAAFLPEYFTTVLVSFLVSWLLLLTPLPAMPWGARRWHTFIALSSYAGVLAWLVFLTLWYRVKYGDVRCAETAEGERVLHAWGRTLFLPSAVAVHERTGSLFGRGVRIMRVVDRAGQAIEFSDAVVEYEELRREVLASVSPACRQRDELTALDERDLSQIWNHRHRCFPNPHSLAEVAQRFWFRMFCMAPVAVFDMALHAALLRLALGMRHPEWVVYVIPISLLLSALVARFVYFYLLTNLGMHFARQRPAVAELLAQPRS